jgi:hypothetical protein
LTNEPTYYYRPDLRFALLRSDWQRRMYLVIVCVSSGSNGTNISLGTPRTAGNDDNNGRMGSRYWRVVVRLVVPGSWPWAQLCLTIEESAHSRNDSTIT